MISKEEVIKLAKLARLDFSDDELDKIIKDMDDIIAFADTINNSVEGDADKSGIFPPLPLLPRNLEKTRLSRHFLMKKFFQTSMLQRAFSV